MNIIGIIPARMASSRFPGKPLAKINNIPMIGHIYFRSSMSNTLSRVYIATCDEEIKKFGDSIGAQTVMTSAKHERAADRTAEAMIKVEEKTGRRVDIACMIQGDEPMVTPEMIDMVAEPLVSDTNVLVANLMHRIRTKEDGLDPNTVKVVVDKNNFALYYSREPIPSDKKAKTCFYRYNQVSITPFRRDFLIEFNKLLPTPLEIIESIDMMRVLEHGYRVKMVPMEFDTHSVDTLEDLKLVEEMMKKDPLVIKYKDKFERGEDNE